MRLSETAILLVIGQLAVLACSRQSSASRTRVEPVYDAATGRLRVLQYDSDGDGKIDQWQHYDRDQKIEKLGFSLRHDGTEDAWSYLGPDGNIARIESSARRDGKVSRIEHYEKGQLVSAEEDTDADGRIDKWETYDGERLATVAFDTLHRGAPDRRIVYRADTIGRVEVDPHGTGQFAPLPDAPRAGHRPRP